MLIDFKALWILETVVESWENIARSATVLRDLTSSRFISFVSRRFCLLMSRNLTVIYGGEPLEFCNQADAPDTTLSTCQRPISNGKSLRITFVEVIYDIFDERT
jgi:hypothetical protein